MVNLFTKNGELKRRFIEVALNSDMWDSFSLFSDYLSDESIAYDQELLDQWILKIEKNVLEQLHNYSILIYQLMFVTNDWGYPGRSQIDQSFSRYLLKLSPDQPFSFQHSIDFHQVLKQDLFKNGMHAWTEQKLKHEFDNLAISLLDRSFTIHEFVDLNRCLRFLGSSLFVQGGVYGLAKEFMAGSGFVETYGDYTCVTLEKEIVRSPNTIVAMAAVIGDKDIFIRMESLRTIFYLKWMGSLQAWKQDTQYWDDTRCYSEAIKRECLRRYSNLDESSVLAIKETFVYDLRETVMFHELGHGVIQQQLLSKDAGAIGEASKVIGENGITALLEFLADFSPSLNGIKGPIQNMIDVSKTDIQRAECMFWMYVADTWFFDTDDDYMFLYSDLMAASLISVVSNEGHIDWDLLLSYIDSDSSRTEYGLLVQFSLSWVEEYTGQWISLLESASFDLPDLGLFNFSDLKSKVLFDLEDEWEGNAPFNASDYQIITAMWAKLFEYFQLYSDSFNDYKQLILNQDQLLYNAFFSQFIDSKQIQNYESDLHVYVEDQLKIKGIFWK